MEFNASATREKLIAELRKIKEEQKFSKAVIGISGGKDSSVAAALLCRAYGPENVYGIMLPDKNQPDIQDSEALFEHLHMEPHTINIGEIHEAFLNQVTPFFGFQKEPNINVGPRLRMTVLRYAAQSLNGRLAGTGNLSEAFVGYCTKDGDMACDFNVLGSLTSVEVVEVGLTMEELPRWLVEKAPTDGLSGKTDEERLGVTYRQIHDYIRTGTSGNDQADQRITALHAASEHKRHLPPVLGKTGG